MFSAFSLFCVGGSFFASSFLSAVSFRENSENATSVAAAFRGRPFGTPRFYRVFSPGFPVFRPFRLFFSPGFPVFRPFRLFSSPGFPVFRPFRPFFSPGFPVFRPFRPFFSPGRRALPKNPNAQPFFPLSANRRNASSSGNASRKESLFPVIGCGKERAQAKRPRGARSRPP